MKKLFLLGASVFLLFILFACGKADDPNKKKIVYWSMWNEVEPQGQVIKAAIEDFMKKHPDITVEVNWNGREIRKTLQPALDNNQTIDIWDEDLERTIRTWGKYALPLDDYIAKSYEGTDGKAYQDVVIKSLLDLGKTFSDDGKLYAVPYQPFTFLIMYNKDHFAKAGITKVPETWAEFKDACAKLKAAEFIPITVDDAYVDVIIGYQIARYKGSDWVKKLVQEGLWDDPAVLQAAKDWEEMYKLGYISPNVAGNKYPQGQQEIANGEVSMYLNGTWLVNEIMPTTGPDFPWGQFAYPTVPNGVSGLYDLNYGGQSFQVNKNTQYPEEVFQLIVHLTTGEWDKQLAEKTYGVPMANTTDWPKQLTDAKEVFSKLGSCYPWAGGIEFNPDKTPIITAAFTGVLTGKNTAEQFIAEVKK
ncbi:ABC transporter substrate-binding protein [Brachyspira hampsonii]|uniref:Sugar ABC transporter substrate-binding protein n=1 Tax=Brachyspira hampsonii TaxID=1287055 RepID=A0AAC9TTC1_9SPIR|nr:ABC transporter substrate-binding protein [Brachyspira hampsonii]ASJ20334.1 sugar ABC transporter substrate-binding protein [Brachyspira hampsonii]ELV06676.1 sugar ABC transporter periplasmic protein [Brachyspira hampsonii 30599]MBW5380443.1 carbohydrate ABC transporter substrate-binding protein [Brachyspira hampsonii]MBW5409633.1 carbohydrate ABC transporter substrate-binding protein [Brachyspira hampsonii]OEJ16341.1 sugar ABC transporter substrate-binding protein [Brachyspira hampsonii]